MVPLGPAPQMSWDEMWRKGYLVNAPYRPGENGAPLRKTLELRHKVVGPSDRAGPSESARLSALLRQDYARSEPAVPDYPPVRGFSYRIPVLSEAEAQNRRIAEVLGLPRTPEEKEAALMQSLVRKALAEREAFNRNKPISQEAERLQFVEAKTGSAKREPIVDEFAGPIGLRQPDAGNQNDAVFDAGPPTDQPVDVFDMYRRLRFDPGGPGRWNIGSKNILDIDKFLGAKNEAEEATARHFPGEKPHNNPADAFKHALWSYKMTKAKDAAFSKEITDALEISFPGDHPGDRLMDLYNNNIGRQLASDPQNEGRNDEEVILEALKDGKLQTQYFNLLSVPHQLAPPSILDVFRPQNQR
jgi:hypothetical protein